MKSIKLTKDHESKLLEMCKELFPGYVHYQIQNYYSMSDYVFQIDKPDGEDNNGFDAIELLTEKSYEHTKGYFNGKGISIHWFEFVMTHLFSKLIVEKYGYMSISDAMSNGYYLIYNENPIDYLYKEFKKLK